jgi:RNA polymerase sigma-70 factor (ECF subfamily)
MLRDEELEIAFAAGRATWPTVALSLQRFSARMRELGVTGSDLVARAADLFLTTGCAAADREAQRAFDETYLARLDHLVGRPGIERHLLDEIRQKVRLKLLAGDEPRIGSYGGRGALLSWVRVTAARVTVDVLAAAGEGARDVRDVGDLLVSSDPSPELEMVKRRYRADFQAALDASLGALPARDRTLLRLHFIEGLNFEEIGAIYRVHRATVFRWMIALRQRVFSDICQRFALRLGASTSELRSLVGLLSDDLQASAKRMLGVAG